MEQAMAEVELILTETVRHKKRQVYNRDREDNVSEIFVSNKRL